MKTRTRVLSMIMTVALLLTSLVIVVPTSVSAAADANLWTDYAADAFEGGTGTEEDPYLIKNAEQLALMAKLVNETDGDANTYRFAYYQVIANIDASAHQWVAIGNDYGLTGSFKGHFDAGIYDADSGEVVGCYTITTVINDKTNQVDDTGSTTVSAGGLFGGLRAATVENVSLKTTIDIANSPLCHNGMYGGLAGAAFACTFTNCHVNATASGQVRTATIFGGIAGYLSEGCNLTSCTVSGSISLTNLNATIGGSKIGGFAGRLNGGTKTVTFTNCANYATVSQKGSGQQTYVGGFFGTIEGDAASEIYVFNNCVNFGDVIGNAFNGNTAPFFHLGGFSGHKAANGVLQINGFVNLGEVRYYERDDMANGTRVGVAELIGTDCSNTAELTVENYYTVNTQLPLIYRVSGTAKVNGAEVSSAKTYYAFDEVTQDFVIESKIDGEDTVISLPKGAMDIIEAVAKSVTVYRGDVAAEAAEENADKGTYDYRVKGNVTDAAYIAIEGYAGESTNFVDLWLAHATVPATGSGTKDDYYVINTAEELAYISSLYRNVKYSKPTVYAKLGKDIDLGGREWTSIGSYMAPGMNYDLRFVGTFDGQNFAIENMTITDLSASGDLPAALFGATGGETTIKDFTLTGTVHRTVTNVSANAGTSMLLGFTSGNTRLTNIDIDGVVDAYVTGAFEPIVAGAVATGNNGYLTDITMRGSVTVTVAKGESQNVCAGGIMGVNQGYGSIIDCVNYADVTVYANTTTAIAGGIVGKTAGSFAGYQNKVYTIENCINAGDVAILQGLSGASNNPRVGGIVGNPGRNSANCVISISDCISVGQVYIGAGVNIGGSSGVGAIVGLNEIADHGDTKYSETGLYITDCAGVMTNQSNALVGNSASRTVNDTAIPADGAVIVPNSPGMYFEMDAKAAEGNMTVTVTKDIVDFLLAHGFELNLVYGENVEKDLTNATAVGNTYVWTFAEIAATEGEDGELVAPEPEFVLSKGDITVTPATATWAGLYAAESFANDNPETTAIEIATAAELGLFAHLVNSGETYKQYRIAEISLLNDIDLAGVEWQPIGQNHTGYYGFYGGILGNGYAIQNMTLTDDSYSYAQAMFGYVGSVQVTEKQMQDVTNAETGETTQEEVSVKVTYTFHAENLIIDSPVIGVTTHNPSTIPSTATLVGSMYGGTIDNVKVEKLDMFVVPSITDLYISGMVGYLKDAIITNSTVNGEIVVMSDKNSIKIGGFVARASASSTVTDCVNNANITALIMPEDAAGWIRVGGIVGAAQSDVASQIADIAYNTNNGTIDVMMLADAKLVGVAGIVGAAYTNGDGSIFLTGNVNLGEVLLTLPETDDAPVEGEDANEPVAEPIVATAGIMALNNYSTVEFVENVSLTNDTVLGLDLATDGELIIEDNHAYDIDVETYDVSVRVDLEDASNSGMRFDTAINKSAYDALVADGVSFKLGTLIAPTDLSFDVAADVVYAVNDYVLAGNGVNGFIADDGEYLTFGAALTSIKDADRCFSAKAYASVTIGETTYTIEADAIEDVSLAEVAAWALESGLPYSQAQLDAIQAMIPVA